jgi:hypothetical protein
VRFLAVVSITRDSVYHRDESATAVACFALSASHELAKNRDILIEPEGVLALWLGFDCQGRPVDSRPEADG